MKITQSILFILFLTILLGCKDYNEPLLHTDIYISVLGQYGLLYDKTSQWDSEVSRCRSELPPKIKRIIQFSGDTIMSIIEYDTKGNEIFNFSKSYIGEFWNGKYITTIAGNIFEDDKLIKTYFFHSNIGFSLSSFEYGLLKKKIDVKEIKGNCSINSNPFIEIDTIHSLHDLLNHEMVDSLNNISTSNYSLIWRNPIWENEMEEYYVSEQESNKRTYYYDEQDRLKKVEWPTGNINLYNYGRYGLVDYYEISANGDTTRIKNIKYDKDGFLDTLNIDNWIHVYDYENGEKVKESVFNGEICIRITNIQYDNLGYPTLIKETDCSGKLAKLNNYHYKFEYYK